MNQEFVLKDDIKMIQGIAVMLMVFHHLFGFPDRIAVSYYAMFDFGFVHLETMLASFGRICVAIFSFCSGYGLYKKNVKLAQRTRWTLVDGYKEIFQSIRKFYFRYWMVFAFFIPYGFYKGIYEFVPLQFIKNVLGLACTYNKEWWYVYTYLRLLVVFPLLFYLTFIIMNKQRQKSFFVANVGVICLFTVAAYVSTETVVGFLSYFMAFYIGILAAAWNAFERLLKFIKKKTGALSWMVVLAVCILFAGIRVFITSKIDFLVAPVIIFCCIYWFHSKWAVRPLKFLMTILGKYSQYIWLTHTFFAYYYFQKYLYSLTNSWIIFGVCLTICTCVGMVLETFLQKGIRVVNRGLTR